MKMEEREDQARLQAEADYNSLFNPEDSFPGDQVLQ